MNMPDMPVQVPVDDPNADTEWNDILRAHKIIPEKPPSPSKEIEEVMQQVHALAHENRLEGLDLDELAELEDDEDEAFLEAYAQRRRAELSALQRREVHGAVYPLQKADYARDVTEASKGCSVLVLLTADNDESRVLRGLWRTAAERWRDVKFCEIRGDMCIEGYPARNCPTVLVYMKGEMERQVIGLGQMGGIEMGMRELQAWMVSVGAVKLGDSRLKGTDGDEEEEEERGRGGKKGGLTFGKKAKAEDEDDSDWD
ncbi:phosducin family protein [Geopyxis carbonaria]|nr:phosducin family protein [Geopyxis carbonaria]